MYSFKPTLLDLAVVVSSLYGPCVQFHYTNSFLFRKALPFGFRILHRHQDPSYGIAPFMTSSHVMMDVCCRCYPTQVLVASRYGQIQHYSVLYRVLHSNSHLARFFGILVRDEASLLVLFRSNASSGRNSDSPETICVNILWRTALQPGTTRPS